MREFSCFLGRAPLKAARPSVWNGFCCVCDVRCLERDPTTLCARIGVLAAWGC